MISKNRIQRFSKNHIFLKMASLKNEFRQTCAVAQKMAFFVIQNISKTGNFPINQKNVLFKIIPFFLKKVLSNT